MKERMFPKRFSIYAIASIALLVVFSIVFFLLPGEKYVQLEIFLSLATALWLISSIEMVVQKKQKWLRIINIIGLLLPVVMLLPLYIIEYLVPSISLRQIIPMIACKYGYDLSDVLNWIYTTFLLIAPILIWITSLCTVIIYAIKQKHL